MDTQQADSLGKSDAGVRESEIHDVFFAALLLKGLNAITELIAGILLLFISSGTILRIVMHLTRNEVLDDPHDFFANVLVHTAEGYAASGSSFVAFYLIAHGVIKTALIAGILKGYRFAYPAYAWAMSVLVAYQLYRVATHHSALLLLFTVFDMIVIILAVHEYRKLVKAQRRSV